MKIREIEVEDPKLKEQIKTFASLSEQIDKAENEIKKLKNQFSEIEDVLRPILDEMEETQDKALEIEGILVTIKKQGYDRTSAAYKDAFNWLHKRVNPAMKKLADEAVEATKKTSHIASKIAVQRQKVDENVITRATDLLKKYWGNLLSTMKKYNNELDDSIKDFKNE